jgi:hypothetical protein
MNLSMKLENRMNIPCVAVRALFVITFFALVQSVTADIRYNIVGIGDYQNATRFITIEGRAMNNLGEAVGMYYDPSDGSQHGFHFSDSGFQTVQGLSLMSRINDNGQMIGQNIYGSYFYSQGTGLMPLGVTAYDINNAGVMVGNSSTGAVRFSLNGDIQYLGAFTVGGINNSGTVIGARPSPSGNYETVMFRDGVGLVPIGEPIGFGGVTHLNDHDMAVGYAGQFESLRPVMLQNGQLVTITNLASQYFKDINNHGVIVGGFDNSFVQRALMWSSVESSVDLNTLIDPNSGWVLITAVDINDAGQILGNGYYNGMRRTFRLDPIPEPGTCALAVAGAAVFMFTSRRKTVRRKQPRTPSHS